jgi:hypothetical protein
MVHLGTIYSSRNFSKFKGVIDNLNSSLYSVSEITLINIGWIEENHLIEFKSKNNKFKSIKPMTREKALQSALNADLLILLQHEDDRSQISFPYKTWDYLNMGIPIFAILNNDELKSLLDSLGHYTCNINDEDSIKESLIRFLNDYSSKPKRKFKSNISLMNQSYEFIQITK